MADRRQLDAGAKKLRDIGYLGAIEAIAKGAALPFWWTRGDGSYCTGTLCVVHTGERLIGITAAHVHRWVLEGEYAPPDGHCQIGATSFEPAKRLIDISDELDIATYELSEIQANAARADIHFATEWPPALNSTDWYLVGGWPWELSQTSRARDDHVTHNFLSFITRLQNSSEDSLSFLTETATAAAWGPRGLPDGTQLGGMSGGPIFRVCESERIVRLALVGTIYEYHSDYEIIQARPCSLIDARGRLLDRGYLPPRPSIRLPPNEPGAN
jgi:hypothetical protein